MPSSPPSPPTRRGLRCVASGQILAGGARFLTALLILLAFQLAGSWLVHALHVQVPGSVAGMLLLVAAIEVGVLRPSLVTPAADLLVRHLALLYVPAGVAVMLYTGLLRQTWVAVVAGGLASLVAVLIVVGVTVQRLERAE